MLKKITNRGSGGKIFKPAIVSKQLTENWFPANPNVLKEIRHKIRNKHYRTTKEVLLETRNDPALYTYLINLVEPKNNKSNLEVLSEIQLANLENLLPIASSTISKFDITKIQEAQAQNIQLMIINSVAAQILGLQRGINPEDAYLTSILRMLGLTMAAWNHQHNYSKSFQITGSVQEIDTVLTKKLEGSVVAGFIRLAADWNLPLEIYHACVQNNPFSKLEDLKSELEAKLEKPKKETVVALSEICQISEGLGLATISYGTKSAETLWEKSIESVNQILGPDGIESIEESVNNVWKNYAPLFSGWYDNIFSRDGKLERHTSDYGKKYFSSNKFIQQCAPEIQQAFSELYQKMTDAEAALGTFHSLITDLVPSSGFMEGSIYIADQSTMEIKQLMTLGRAAHKDYRPAYTMNRMQDLDPIVKSLMSGTIVKGRVTLDSKEIMYVSGAIGAPPNQLIIYLETSHGPYLTGELDATICFRAVQQFIFDSFMCA